MCAQFNVSFSFGNVIILFYCHVRLDTCIAAPIAFSTMNDDGGLGEQVNLFVEVLLYTCYFLHIPYSHEVNKYMICVILLYSEIAYLRLVKLDISGNRISTLPVELRTMTTLVDLNLSHNPLTSPPSYVSGHCS